MEQALSIDGICSLFISYGKTNKSYPKYEVESEFSSCELLIIV